LRKSEKKKKKKEEEEKKTEHEEKQINERDCFKENSVVKLAMQ